MKKLIILLIMELSAGIACGYSQHAEWLIQALVEDRYVVFDTPYKESATDLPYYVVLRPFEYGNVGVERGVAYYVTYGEYISEDNLFYEFYLRFYGEYEIMGDYLRIRDIRQVGKNDRIDPYAYQIMCDSECLYGGFPRHRTERMNYSRIRPVTNLIIEALEGDNVCRHR